MSRVDIIAALASVSMEVGPLKELAGWPPVGSLLGEIPAALSGTGGLTLKQIVALRRWARRWTALSHPLRAFYAVETSDPARDPGVVDAAVWRVLEGASRPPLTRRQYGALQARWRDRYGYVPSMELCPRPEPGSG